jgi:hypothetical protein
VIHVQTELLHLLKPQIYSNTFTALIDIFYICRFLTSICQMTMFHFHQTKKSRSKMIYHQSLNISSLDRWLTVIYWFQLKKLFILNRFIKCLVPNLNLDLVDQCASSPETYTIVLRYTIIAISNDFLVSRKIPKIRGIYRITQHQSKLLWSLVSFMHNK